MKNTFLKSFFIPFFILSAIFSGCEKDEDNRGSNKIKIAMVTDIGGINDQSFNQSAWEGLKKAETDFDIDITYKESKQQADYNPNFETLIDSECDLIWGIGYLMGKSILEAAKNNPEQKFAIVDMSYGTDTPSNVNCVVFKAEEGSFLAGYIAGKMTKTNKIGFIGGIEGDIISAFDYGFQAGVIQANPETEILRQYAGCFDDAGKGKSIALNMYHQGADIVFHAAGAVGEGLIEAAKEENKWAIGVDRDQSSLAPENVLTSVIKRVDNALYNVASELNSGKFNGGKTTVYGLQEKGVGIAETSDKHVPEEILNEVKELETLITSDKIKVPSNEETFTVFKPYEKNEL